MLQKTNEKIMLTDTSYEVAKRFVQIILPAFSALYFGLANIWGLPAAEQVVGTIAVVTTFLGVCLGISTHQYNESGAAYDGRMVIEETEDKKMFSMELDEDPETLENKDSVRFKVVGYLK